MAPSFKLEEWGDYCSAFAALTDIELTCEMNIKTKPLTTTGKYIISPTDKAATDALRKIVAEGKTTSGKAVQLTELPDEHYYIAVLTRVPKDITPDDIRRLHPSVTKAIRLTTFDHVKREAVPTASMKIWGKGDRPEVLHLGSLGPRQVRPFVPEPLRCYRCQMFGHHQDSCTKPYRCSICSKNHKTSDCLKKKEQSIEVEIKCPNCSGSHTAASLACPIRKANARQTAARFQKSQMPQQWHPQLLKDPHS